ncbi:ACT domain-containing protein [Actinospongicola halichondriae]|uniref:ACT domain-containing protein n=1 Tax=Actinospongicola halichondriae TaxID=3236844 RepID=UPI003D48FA2D
MAQSDELAPDDTAAVPTPRVQHVVIEVSLPDRPGALGAVASRIGAVGGDITDVVVAARTPGFAEDVFHVDLPVAADRLDLVGLVLDEISQVDGVAAPSISHRPEGDCCT